MEKKIKICIDSWQVLKTLLNTPKPVNSIEVEVMFFKSFKKQRRARILPRPAFGEARSVAETLFVCRRTTYHHILLFWWFERCSEQQHYVYYIRILFSTVIYSLRCCCGFVRFTERDKPSGESTAFFMILIFIKQKYCTKTLIAYYHISVCGYFMDIWFYRTIIMITITTTT